MSIACSITPVREISEGKVSFSNWEGLNDYEKMAATFFEEGIENNFDDFPPSLHVNADSDDVLLTFGIGEALGDGAGIGPAWNFSFRDTLKSVTDCYPDDVKTLIAAMRSLADYAESLITNNKE